MNFVVKTLIVFCAVSQLAIVEGAHNRQGANARIQSRLSFPEDIVLRNLREGTTLPEIIHTLRAARNLNSVERAQRIAEDRHRAEMRLMDAEIKRMEAKNEEMEAELRRMGVLGEEDDTQSTVSALSFDTAHSTRTQVSPVPSDTTSRYYDAEVSPSASAAERTPRPRTLSPPRRRKSTRQRAKRCGNEEA